VDVVEVRDISNERERAWRRHPLPKEMMRKICMFLEGIDGSVLDIGCGYGNYTKQLEREHRYVVGVDVRNSFDRSKISSSLDFCLADGFRFPFRDGSFQAAVSLDVIEHVADDLAFLLEIRRVMKKDASLVLETPNRERLSNRMRKALGREVRYPYDLGVDPILGRCIHLREYSRRDLIHLLVKAGFEPAEVEALWLGLQKFRLGFSRFPKLLNSYAQCWLVRAIRR